MCDSVDFGLASPERCDEQRAVSCELTARTSRKCLAYAYVCKCYVILMQIMNDVSEFAVCEINGMGRAVLLPRIS